MGGSLLSQVLEFRKSGPINARFPLLIKCGGLTVLIERRSNQLIQRYSAHHGAITLNSVFKSPRERRSNQLIQHYSAHHGAITNVTFHPSELPPVVSRWRPTEIWDLREGQLFYTLHGHGGAIIVLLLSCWSFFASAGSDEQVRRLLQCSPTGGKMLFLPG
jgi:WD40 repeat protein